MTGSDSTASHRANTAQDAGIVLGRGSGPRNTFTTAHLTYLHHAERCLGDIISLRGDVTLLLTIAIDTASTAPYVLDQVLALAAAHLATTDPSRHQLARSQAIELQTRALEEFNEAMENMSEDSYIPKFLFATLLGIHVLGETLPNQQNGLPQFLEAFVGYARLHRGVRAVVTAMSWKAVLASDLQPLVYVHRLSNHVKEQTPGTDTLALSKFLGSSGEDGCVVNACQEALKQLQWVFDMCNQDPSRADVGVHATMAWPLLVPQEYLNLLLQMQPEALMVMVFYAAVLYRHRHFWAFGSAGSVLIDMLSANLDSRWHDSPAWPNHVLFEAGLF
ncbi:hypothetical protein GT037_009603 [Alternaria burnsii]|uniref:Uncharacterized protein n=1 Tax=Alternaria burnsii TaxID=1187904 RepID=A0A8H7AXU3_9PLEO|nr:uncharacterized protein GT037_009603 [Alternaria burnsii]KAF7672572.1 hypothetical protein GT037_009603 [Alternaria burnsii]CAI9634487.1 unnamed protein product [Alternaria burnsii]